MSYNLLSGSVEFVGDALGIVENLVDKHTTQTVSGAKLFTNITASSEGDGTIGLKVVGNLTVDGDTLVDGDVSAAQYVKHDGDPDTNIEFGADEITLNAGGKMLFNAPAGGPISINGDGNPANAGDLDFVVYSNNINYGMKLDANTKSIQLGWIANPTFNRSDVLVSISGSTNHTGSLLSVGHGKDPILAVSGAIGNIGQSPRVVITGSVMVGGQDANITTAGNITAGAVVSGSKGIRGEILNIGNGLEHVAGGGEKKLSAKADTSKGMTVGNNGIGMNAHGLTTIGSINTSATNQDFLVVTDYDDSNLTKKVGLGDILDLTHTSVGNAGTGIGEVYKTTTSREIKLRNIKHSSPISVVNGTNDITIGLDPIGGSGQVTYNNGTTNTGTSLIVIDDKPGTGYMDHGFGTVTLGGANVEVNATGALAVKGMNYDGHTQGDSILFRVDGHTNQNLLVVTGSGRVGINTNAPIAALDVGGKIAITQESATPSAPLDGQGYLYTKAGGGLYWRSFDLGEMDLTTGGAVGGNGEIQYNNSGSLYSKTTFTIVSRDTPAQSEVYLTGTLHTQRLEVQGVSQLYSTRAQHLTCSEGLFLQAGMRTTVNFQTSNYSLDASDSVVIFSNSSNLTGTLPIITDDNVGMVYTIKNINSGEVHITGSNPGIEQYIDGSQYLVLSGAVIGNGPYISVVSYPSGGGFDWAVIARQLDSL